MNGEYNSFGKDLHDNFIFPQVYVFCPVFLSLVLDD